MKTELKIIIIYEICPFQILNYFKNKFQIKIHQFLNFKMKIDLKKEF